MYYFSDDGIEVESEGIEVFADGVSEDDKSPDLYSHHVFQSSVSYHPRPPSTGKCVVVPYFP